MKPLVLLVAFMVMLLLGTIIGYVVAKAELRARVRRDMERQGWSTRHQKIYHSAIGVLNKIVRAHDLDAPMEFRVVQLPEILRSDARNVINRYREEIDA